VGAAVPTAEGQGMTEEVMVKTVVLHAALHDDEWNKRARDESAMQRLDRNWADVVQELRVLQTGVQLLTGFLLILPFQSRFHELTVAQTTVYLVTVAAAVGATGCLIAPVSMHRILFRLHARRVLVGMGHRLIQVGLGMLALATIGVVLLVFDVVGAPGLPATVSAAVVLLVLWLGLPLWIRHHVRAGSPGIPTQSGAVIMARVDRVDHRPAGLDDAARPAVRAGHRSAGHAVHRGSRQTKMDGRP
jgi:hypothetical protein